MLSELGILRWFRLVEGYCLRSLTKASDKLPASGGLAKWMQQYVGGAYAAGLWKEYFVHCLLWIAEDETSRPSEYRAPSWSWASVEGPVSYWKFLHKEDILSFRSTLSFVQVELHTSTESSYGEIQGGKVQLEGWLTEQVRTDWLNRCNGADLGWYVCWDTTPKEAVCQLLSLGICTDNGHETEQYLILGHVNSHRTVFSRIGVASANIGRSGFPLTENDEHGCYLPHCTQYIRWPGLDITTTLKRHRLTIV